MAGTRGGAISEQWDRVVASDPGLTRLRTALSAMVAMSSTLAVEFGYAKATHAVFEGIVIAMLLGGVMSMLGSMALAGIPAWPKVRAAAFFPVAIGSGMLPGVLVAGHTDAMLTVFVAVMFVAVYVRRFGPAFFFYGFMFWMGYFFAAFLGATLSTLPPLIGDVIVATAWVLLLSVTVLRTHPQRAFGRVRRSFEARTSAVARACADVLESGGDPRRRAWADHRLHKRSLRLAEAALMIEAWSGQPGTIPPGWTGEALRGRVLDVQLAVDALAHAATALADEGGAPVAPAARVAGHLARREHPAAVYATRELLAAVRPGGPGWRSASDFAAAALDLVDSVTGSGVRVGSSTVIAAGAGTKVGPATDADARTTLRAAVVEPPADEPSAAEAEPFAPMASLAMGALPGSFAVAGQVPARGGWNPLSRANLTTRQAVQVAIAGALAIVFGRHLSETRYYWAVIAAFITFTGTATRSESTLKAMNRVFGTLLGLGAGIGLAELTAGHTLWVLAVIVLSMTVGFYLVTISYACMIFCVTIMVAQMYSVLHEFTPGLLVLRLEETALGAAIGITVGLVILPTSTRDTIRAARLSFFEAMATLLRATAARLEGGGADEGDPAALTRALEDRMRQLALVSRPLTRPLIWRGDPKSVRHRLTLYATAARHTRALATAPVRIADPGQAAALAESCRVLAITADNLAVNEPQLSTRAQIPADAVPAVPAQPVGGGHPAADLYRLLSVLALLSPADSPQRTPEPAATADR
jgi:Fusaric acid resistance protein-like